MVLVENTERFAVMGMEDLARVMLDITRVIMAQLIVDMAGVVKLDVVEGVVVGEAALVNSAQINVLPTGRQLPTCPYPE